MAKDTRKLLIESSEFVSKVKLSKNLKESVKLSAGKAGTLIVKNVPCTILNRKNLNGRIYSTRLLEAAIQEAQDAIASRQLLCAGNEHPEGSFVPPTEASHVVINAYIKKNINVVVEGKHTKSDVLFMDLMLLNTENGKNARALFEAECSVGTSIRGLGDLNGDMVENYQLLGVDLVGQPSSSTYTRMPVSESVKVELADEKVLSEGFTVSTSATNVVRDLETASDVQNRINAARYGTIVKTSTKVDEELNPKTGATTSITTLETETQDDVASLDQALSMAKKAMLNGVSHIDSITIDTIEEEEDKKEAVTAENADTPVEEGLGGAILGGLAGAAVGHPLIGAGAGYVAGEVADKLFDSKESVEHELVRYLYLLDGTVLKQYTEDDIKKLATDLRKAKEKDPNIIYTQPYKNAYYSLMLNPKVDKDYIDYANGVKWGLNNEHMPDKLKTHGEEATVKEGKEDYPRYQEIHMNHPGFYPFIRYFRAAIAKFGESAWDMSCNFLDYDMDTVYTGKIESILGEEQSDQWLADNGNAYYGIDFPKMPLEQWLETEYKESTEATVKEGKLGGTLGGIGGAILGNAVAGPLGALTGGAAGISVGDFATDLFDSAEYTTEKKLDEDGEDMSQYHDVVYPLYLLNGTTIADGEYTREDVIELAKGLIKIRKARAAGKNVDKDLEDNYLNAYHRFMQNPKIDKDIKHIVNGGKFGINNEYAPKNLVKAFDLDIKTEARSTESITEAKDEKEDKTTGRKFVLRTPSGFVSMDGNALVFKADPKEALHFVQGKEESGLVHLSGVQKILDTMGVYDVEKYYRKDKKTNVKQPTQDTKSQETGDSQAIDNNTEDKAGINEEAGEQYSATVAVMGHGSNQTTEIPVSARDVNAMNSEISNLYDMKVKSAGDGQTVEVKVHDKINQKDYAFNPKTKSVDFNNPEAQTESAGDIEQKDDTLKVDIADGMTVEKEFDSPAAASVVKSGLETGKIPGEVMLDEADDEHSILIHVEKQGSRTDGTPTYTAYFFNKADRLDMLQQLKDDIDSIIPDWGTEWGTNKDNSKQYIQLYNVTENQLNKVLTGLQKLRHFEFGWDDGVGKITAPMGEKLYAKPTPGPSDDFIEKPLNDSTETVTITLSDIDWDIDSVADLLLNQDKDLTWVEKINTLPSTLEVTITANELNNAEDLETLKNILIKSANEMSKVVINGATIADVK